jgi:hypothetical protein
VVAVASGGRLMFWFEGRKGARELARLTVSDKHQFFVLQKDHDLLCLLRAEPNSSSGLLIRVRLSDLDVATRRVDHGMQEITDVKPGESGALIFGVDNRGQKLCSELAWLGKGLVDPTVAPPFLELPKDLQWRQGRVLRLMDGSFYAVSVASYGYICLLQRLPDFLKDSDQVVEFASGKYAALRQGRLFDYGSCIAAATPVGEELKGSIAGIEEVSEEGLVAVKVHGMKGLAIVDLHQNQVVATETNSRGRSVLELRVLRQLTTSFRMRSSLRCTSVATNWQAIFLRDIFGKFYVVQLDDFVVKLSAFGESMRERMRDFNRQERGRAADFGLLKASWISGGVMWFDPRGLLHMKSADPQHAEVTLVLTPGVIAGWTSEGVIFGNSDYFESSSEFNSTTRGLRQAQPAIVWRTVIIPLLESLL